LTSFCSFQKLKKKGNKALGRVTDISESNTSINSIISGDSLTFDDSLADASLKKSVSNSEISSLAEQDYIDNSEHDTRSLNEMDNLTIRISPEKVINLPSLTEAQVRAITGKPCDFSIFVFIICIFCFDELNGKAVLTAFLSHIKLQQFLIKP